MTETTITVRGQHTATFPAEHATVQLAVNFDGAKRSEVFNQASHTADDVRAQIVTLHNESIGPVITWSSDRVRVWGDRPWNSDGKRMPIVYHANIDFRATFTDFDALARFLEGVAETAGINIGSITWELSRETTESVTAEVRTSAVHDAIAKAKTYAQALGLSSVTATSIADQGMLGNQSTAAAGGLELVSARGLMRDGGTPQLSFTPQDIEVSAIVDAKFIAN